MIRPVFSTNLDYTLSEEELNLDTKEIILYPNPAQNLVNIDGLDGFFTVAIYDLSGRRVTFAENEHTIDVNHLDPGLYLVDIRDEDGNSLYAKKLVKE